MKEININIEGYNANGICVGCLNYQRKMFYAENVKDCFKILADINVPDGLSIQVCWECLAYMQSLTRFRAQILKSFGILTEYSKEHPYLIKPSDLTQYATERITMRLDKDIILPQDTVTEPIPIEMKKEVDEEECYIDMDVAAEEDALGYEPKPGDFPVQQKMTSKVDIQLPGPRKVVKIGKPKKIGVKTTSQWKPDNPALKKMYDELYDSEDDEDQSDVEEIDECSEEVDQKIPSLAPFNILGIFDNSGEENSRVSLPSMPGSAEQMVAVGDQRRGCSVRRGTGARGCRVGGTGRGRRGRLGGHTGTRAARCAGGPIQEVYVTDDELPDDLRETIMEVTAWRTAAKGRKRNARAAENEVFVDADVDGDAALFPGDAESLHFDWRPMNTFEGEREPFLPQETGPTASSGSAYEAFRQFWDEEVLTHIVTETNRYVATEHHLANWYDTNVHEIMILFTFWMMFGIIRMPSIKSCFSACPLLSTSCFRTMFSRQRYEHLCTALCFNNNSVRTPESSKLFSIEPILTHLNARFQAAYTPRQEICIDESITLWKGNLSIRQYIKTKAAKFGIKSFELCESATGYLWSFFIYTGKESQPDPSLPASLLKSTASVLRLIRPLLNKGYTLFVDNWFNSPLLARYLKRNMTDVVGTLKANHQHVPPLVGLCKLQDGQFVARHSGDMTVMGYHKKKPIALLSTYHGVEVDLTPAKANRRSQWKPQIVLDYNKSMGGVDLKDGMLESYLLERKKGKKWIMKLFKRLLNVSILNSRICFEASINKRVEHTGYRLELVKQILDRHLSLVPKPRPSAPRPEPVIQHSRFTTHRHWPSGIRKRTAAGFCSRRRCAAKGCNRTTTYECTLCNVGLCADLCFGRYHMR